jgi:hypothetical protein
MLPHLLKPWPSPTFWIKNRHKPEFLQCLPKNGIIAEIGVEKGNYSSILLHYLNPAKFYLIDCWEQQDPLIYGDRKNLATEIQEKIYQKIQAHFGSDPRVEILRTYSEKAAEQFKEEFFDLIYIDANHSYEAVKQDIAAWWPKLKKGGILAGHDYLIFEPFGVVPAVNEFLHAQGLYFSALTTEDYFESWAIQKPHD